jgi:SRSO17 transposase
MIRAVVDHQKLRGRWVTCDEACGRDTGFLDQVAGSGLWDFAEVPHDTQVWRTRPQTAVPPWSGRGRKPTRVRLGPGQAQAAEVSAVAASLPREQWSRHLIKEGRQGPRVADCAMSRVVAIRNGLPGPEVWLVCRRNLDSGALTTSVCNAPAETPRPTLGRLSGMRWPIETCFEEGKH